MSFQHGAQSMSDSSVAIVTAFDATPILSAIESS